MLPVLRERLEDLAARLGLPGLHPAVPAAVIVLLVLTAGWAFTRWGGSGLSPEAGDTFRPAATAEAAAPSSPARSAPSTETSGATAEIVVHVVGAVRRPGVYRLRAGSRGDDAVTAAGGTLGAADVSAVNLARVLADGEQVAIPVRGAAPAAAAVGAAVAGGASPGATAAGGAPVGGKVALNSATAAQLDALPGIGPATAAKIVADREKNGPFASAEDLGRVPGIGPKKVEALKDLVTAP